MGKGRPSISRKLQAEVFCRDRWLCHCCERPVIFAPAMKYLQRLLKDAGYREAAYWRNAYDRHGAPLLDVLAAAVDHVEPFARGGSSELENLRTICNKCNSKKNDSAPEKYARDNPTPLIRSKHGEPVDWDGFSSLFLFLAGKYATDLTPTEKDWVGALKSATSNRGES